MRINESLQDIKTQTGINLNIIPRANLNFVCILENTPKSIVYRGEMDYNRVAIKVYKETEGREEQIKKEILTKANAMMKVHYSDYLVQLRGIVLEKSCYAMVMECFYSAGSLNDLSEVIKHRSSEMNWLDRYDKAWQIAAALKHLHQCGIFHGNLNSNNVLQAADGYPRSVIKLINFGWPSLQKFKDEKPGKEADIYRLGTVLTELATNKIAPPQYQKIISECLDKDLTKRPQADEVVKQLYQLWKDERQRELGETQVIDFKFPSEKKTEFPSPKESLESVIAEYKYDTCIYLTSDGVRSPQAETTSVGAQSTSQPQTILKSEVVNTFRFFTPEDLEAYKKSSNYSKTQTQSTADTSLSFSHLKRDPS